MSIRSRSFRWLGLVGLWWFVGGIAWWGCEPNVTPPASEQAAETTQDSNITEPPTESSFEQTNQENILETSAEQTPEGLLDANELPLPEASIEPTPEASIEPTPEASTEEISEKVPETSTVARCTTETFTHNNTQRLYILCVPDPLPAGALPLVMGFHGGGGNASQWKNTLAWEQTAAKYGFVMVFMQGCNDRLTDCAGNGSYLWNIGKPGEPRTTDDQGYTVEVIQRLSATHNLSIDPKRRFATGHSLGGMFSYALACDKPDLFAAIGPISAPPSDGSCTPSKKTAIVHIHGTDDANVPFATGCCSLEQKTVGDAAYLKGCDTLPRCFNPTNWWPPVRTGVHPYANVTGLDAMAEKGLGCTVSLQETKRTQSTLCRRYTNCPNLGAEICLVTKADHSLRTLDQLFDLREHLWSRFSLIR